jgi:hypothetical protein
MHAGDTSLPFSVSVPFGTWDLRAEVVGLPGLHFQVCGHSNKQGLHFDIAMGRFSIVETVTSSLVRVASPMWSGKMEPKYVINGSHPTP